MSQARLTKKRETLRERMFATRPFYEAPQKGWFKAPRSLPMLLSLLRTKKVSGSVDPGPVYLDLLSRHMDGGIVEIGTEADCAAACGYESTRSIRTWRERMKILVEVGLIEAKESGHQPYRYVLLLPIEHAIDKLERQRKISPGWKDRYFARRLDSGEISGDVDPAESTTVLPRATKPKGKAK